jgi:hypothetical protein
MNAARLTSPPPSPPSDGGEGGGEEAVFWKRPLSSVLSPLAPCDSRGLKGPEIYSIHHTGRVPRGERKKTWSYCNCRSQLQWNDPQRCACRIINRARRTLWLVRVANAFDPLDLFAHPENRQHDAQHDRARNVPGPGVTRLRRNSFFLMICHHAGLLHTIRAAAQCFFKTEAQIAHDGRQQRTRQKRRCQRTYLFSAAKDAHRSAAFMPLQRETESRFEKTRTPGKN